MALTFLYDGVFSAKASALLPAVQLQTFSGGGRQYYAFSGKPVAYSTALEPLVIADFDCDGSVRGIEFLGERQGTIAFYLSKALAVNHSPLAGRGEQGIIAILIGLLRSVPGAQGIVGPRDAASGLPTGKRL